MGTPPGLPAQGKKIGQVGCAGNWHVGRTPECGSWLVRWILEVRWSVDKCDGANLEEGKRSNGMLVSVSIQAVFMLQDVHWAGGREMSLKIEVGNRFPKL